MISADLIETGYQPGATIDQALVLPEGLQGLVDQVYREKARGEGAVTIWADRPVEIDPETDELRVSPGTRVFVPRDPNQLFATIPVASALEDEIAFSPFPNVSPPGRPHVPAPSTPEAPVAPLSESSVLPNALLDLLRRVGGIKGARWGVRTALAAAFIAQAACTPITPPPPTEANIFDQAPAGQMLRTNLQELGIVDESCTLPIAEIEQVRQSGGVASIEGFAAQAEEALQKPHNEHFTQLSCDFNEQTNEVIFYFTDEAGDHFVPTSSGDFLQVGVETDGSLTVLGDPDMNVPKELPRVDAQLVNASSTKELRESRQAVQDFLKGESFGVSTQVTLATQPISVGDGTYRMWEVYGSKDANVRGARVHAPVLVHVLEEPGIGGLRVVAYYTGADGEGLYLVKSITVKDDGSVEYIIDTSDAAVSARVKECGSGTCWATITVDQDVAISEEELKSAAALLSPPVATTRAASALRKWGEGIWIGDFQPDAQIAQGLPEDIQGTIVSAGTVRLRTNTEADSRLGESSGDTSLIIVSDPRFVAVTETGTVVEVDSWLGLVVKPTSTGSSSGGSKESPRVVPFEPRFGKDNTSIEWVVPATGKRIFIQNGDKLTMVVGPNESEVGAQFVPVATEGMRIPTVTESELVVGSKESVLAILDLLTTPELTERTEIETKAGTYSWVTSLSKNGPVKDFVFSDEASPQKAFYTILGRLAWFAYKYDKPGGLNNKDYPEFGGLYTQADDLFGGDRGDTSAAYTLTTIVDKRLNELGLPYTTSMLDLEGKFIQEKFYTYNPVNADAITDIVPYGQPLRGFRTALVTLDEFQQAEALLGSTPYIKISSKEGSWQGGILNIGKGENEMIVFLHNDILVVIEHNEIKVDNPYFYWSTFSNMPIEAMTQPINEEQKSGMALLLMYNNFIDPFTRIAKNKGHGWSWGVAYYIVPPGSVEWIPNDTYYSH